MRFEKPAAGGSWAVRFDWRDALPPVGHSGLFTSRQTGAPLAILAVRFDSSTIRRAR